MMCFEGSARVPSSAAQWVRSKCRPHSESQPTSTSSKAPSANGDAPPGMQMCRPCVLQVLRPPKGVLEAHMLESEAGSSGSPSLFYREATVAQAWGCLGKPLPRALYRGH